MTFYETRFPTRIGKGATGGPERLVDVVSLRSGFEERNAIWAHSKQSWDVSVGIKSLDDLYEVRKLWEAVGGPLHAFRFKDPADWKSCPPLQTVAFNDQAIGTGDGSTIAFQLVKTYSAGAASYTKPIKKPVSGTVKIGVNGVQVVSGWTVDTTSGLVTFSVAPSNGHAITAGFEYDVPVRFVNSKLSTNLELYEAGVVSVELIEVRV
jgi:uncharacterized protein (TIGR02217 family)